MIATAASKMIDGIPRHLENLDELHERRNRCDRVPHPGRGHLGDREHPPAPLESVRGRGQEQEPLAHPDHVGIFVCNIGFFVSLWYLFMVDPQVKRMEKLGPGIGFPGR